MNENSRSNAQREQYRFPCEESEYKKIVGRLLPDILEEILTELGFEVTVNHQQANGVDLEIFQENNLILVAEVVNWSIGSRLTHKRKNSYIKNLSEYDCNKVFIYTVPLSNLDGFKENGIDLLGIGYQILPQTFYNFFSSKGQVERRRVDSRDLRKDIKDKILSYLKAVWLESINQLKDGF